MDETPLPARLSGICGGSVSDANGRMPGSDAVKTAVSDRPTQLVRGVNHDERGSVTLACPDPSSHDPIGIQA